MSLFLTYSDFSKFLRSWSTLDWPSSNERTIFLFLGCVGDSDLSSNESFLEFLGWGEGDAYLLIFFYYYF